LEKSGGKIRGLRGVGAVLLSDVPRESFSARAACIASLLIFLPWPATAAANEGFDCAARRAVGVRLAD
jgi:hypothetical protein